MPGGRPDRSNGLTAPATVVQAPAPDGLNRRLNPVAALCVLSTAGAAQATTSCVPAPCARAAPVGVFGAAAAVVSVIEGDHAPAPAALVLWSCTSIAAPAARADRVYGLVTPDTSVQAPAPDGLDCRLNPMAASCVLSTVGVVQVTMRPLLGPCTSDASLGGFAACGGCVGVGDAARGKGAHCGGRLVSHTWRGRVNWHLSNHSC